MNTLKQLPQQFSGTGEVRGFNFTLICKTERGFLYEVCSNGLSPYFEVFKRKINNRFGCISYPTAKAFGIWAWTYRDKNSAINKLKTL